LKAPAVDPIDVMIMTWTFSQDIAIHNHPNILPLVCKYRQSFCNSQPFW